MISFLKGAIVQLQPTELVIDVGGVGYAVTISEATFEKLKRENGITTILTYMHVREDAMQLFGFAAESERAMFRSLISISGIGPKMALGILSGLPPQDLRTAIVSGNAIALTSISGVGKKTAERIIIELRDSLAKDQSFESTVPPTSGQLKVRSEALVALMSLGHSRSVAEQALRQVLTESPDPSPSVEDLIKRALRYTHR